MKKYRTYDECGRPFSGEPFSDGGSGWRYLFHVDSNSVDGSLEIDVTSRGQVRVGTLARLVDVYLTLCPACLAMVLEVVLQQIKKQAAAEGLLDLSPQPCECIDREECCAGSVAAEITGADAKLPDLDFLNSVHHSGANTTVRRGLKWSRIVAAGDRVQLCDHGKRTGYVAGVLSVIVKKAFSGIQPDDICNEHDPDCRDLAGLERAMRQAYPEFTTNDSCTLLTYRVLGGDSNGS